MVWFLLPIYWSVLRHMVIWSNIRTLKCLHCLVLFLCLFFWRFTDQISNFIGLMVCDDIPYVCIMCPGIGDIFVVVVYVSVF